MHCANCNTRNCKSRFQKKIKPCNSFILKLWSRKSAIWAMLTRLPIDLRFTLMSWSLNERFESIMTSRFLTFDYREISVLRNVIWSLKFKFDNLAWEVTIMITVLLEFNFNFRRFIHFWTALPKTRNFQQHLLCPLSWNIFAWHQHTDDKIPHKASINTIMTLYTRWIVGTGLKIVPCGTPYFISPSSDISSPMQTLNFRLVKYVASQLWAFPVIPRSRRSLNMLSSIDRIECGT